MDHFSDEKTGDLYRQPSSTTSVEYVEVFLNFLGFMMYELIDRLSN